MSMLRWSCICVGAVSLFSVMETATKIVLAPQLNTLLGLYRTILYPIAEKLIDLVKMGLAPYHVNLPIVPLDFVILYTLVSLAIAHFTINQKKQLGSVTVVILLLPFALIWPVLVAGNILALCVSPKLGFSSILFGWDMEFAKVIGTCLAIFGTNSYLIA